MAFAGSSERALRARHDGLFRFTFSQPAHTGPLLRSVLGAEIAAELDWRTLALGPENRFDRRLRRHETDLLFAVRNRSGGEHYVHALIEHTSRVAPTMALRLLEYAVGIWRQLLRERSGRSTLPRIHAVVVHHGRRRWTAPLVIEDLFADRGVGPGAATRARVRAATPDEADRWFDQAISAKTVAEAPA